MTPKRRSRSGPSGPSIPSEQRKRPERKYTLAKDTLDGLTTLASEWGLPVSRVIDRLVAERLAEVDDRKGSPS